MENTVSFEIPKSGKSAKYNRKTGVSGDCDLCKHYLDSGLADWNLDYPLDSGLDFEMEF